MGELGQVPVWPGGHSQGEESYLTSCPGWGSVSSQAGAETLSSQSSLQSHQSCPSSWPPGAGTEEPEPSDGVCWSLV